MSLCEPAPNPLPSEETEAWRGEMAPSVPRSRLVAGWGQICWVLVEGWCAPPPELLQLSIGKYDPCSRAWPPSLHAVGSWPPATRPSRAQLTRITPAGSQGPRARGQAGLPACVVHGSQGVSAPESSTPSVAERHPGAQGHQGTGQSASLTLPVCLGAARVSQA